jgi:hypothetical protein
LGHVHVCEPATAVAAERVGEPRSSKLDGLHQPVLAILDDFHIRADTRYARPRLRKRAYQAQQSWSHEAFVDVQINDYLWLLSLDHCTAPSSEGLLRQVPPQGRSRISAEDVFSNHRPSF